MPKLGWQTFATNNSLRYKSEIFLLREAHVVGDFYGYQVRLETLSRNTRVSPASRLGLSSYESVFTRMILRASKPVALASPDRLIARSKIIDLLLPRDVKQGIKGRFYAYKKGQEIVYEQKFIENSHRYLQTVLDSLKTLIEGYARVKALGAEAIPVLHPVSKRYHVLQHIADQLIFDIGRETKRKLRKQASNLLCPHCLVHCGAHQIKVPWSGNVTYYGCRACSQSRNLIKTNKYRLIVCLNEDLPVEQTNHGATMQINWIRNRRLFDFEEVEIVKASDEDVERFAVQVGNDTDPVRSPKYKQMRCKVSNGCQLSENTIRILQHTFGQIDIKQTAGL